MPKLEEMKRDIDIPDDVTVKYKKGLITVKGERGELKREFSHPRISVSVSKEKVTVKCSRPTRSEMGLTGTVGALIGNMITGVKDGYTYRMRVIYSHFPIKTSVKGDQLVIENFLGERFPRKALIREGVTAKISGDTITIEGNDKEKVGQTAANIEYATRVKNYDPRVFQDGIYLVDRGDN